VITAERLEAARRLDRPEPIDRAWLMLALTRMMEGDAAAAEPPARAALVSGFDLRSPRTIAERLHEDPRSPYLKYAAPLGDFAS
jgi:hypothetical protein